MGRRHGDYLVSQAFVHRFDVFYWRERKEEVDFILRKKNSCRWTWGSYFKHRKLLTPYCFDVILLLYADGESWVYCLNTREKSLLDSKPRRPARAVTEMSE